MALSFNDSLKLKIFSYAKTEHLDQNKNRSNFTGHSKQNNKHMTPAMGSQFIPDNFGQGLLRFML
jgi:hypothetical protein